MYGARADGESLIDALKFGVNKIYFVFKVGDVVLDSLDFLLKSLEHGFSAGGFGTEKSQVVLICG